jgi:hypothetical protein
MSIVQSYRTYLITMMDADKEWMSPPVVKGAHECTNECEFFVDGNNYICKHSGNLHVCSHDNCTRTFDMREGRVCALTNIVYSLDFDEFEYGATYNVDDDSGDKDITVTAECEEIKIDEDSKDDEPSTIDVPKPTSKKQQCVPLAAQLSIYNDDKIYHDFVKIFKELIDFENGKGFFDKLSPHFVRRIVLVCLSLWITIVTSKFWEQSARKRVFRHEYHAVVVMYNMITGIDIETAKYSRLSIVPQVEEMSTMLPILNRINEIEGSDKFHQVCSKAWKRRWFTNYEKNLKTAISAITEQEWDTHFENAKRRESNRYF